MRMAMIGRTETQYKTVELLQKRGNTIGLIIKYKETSDYTKKAEDFQQIHVFLNT